MALALVACSSGGKGANSGGTPVGTAGSTGVGSTSGTSTGGSTGVGGQGSGGTTAAATNPAPAVPWPSLDFVNNPGGKDPNNKLVALSFDDGPDGTDQAVGGVTHTAAILDTLKANNLHATFFICGNLWSHTTATDPLAAAAVKRMLAEGHAIGNHTYEHKSFDSNSTGASDATRVGAAQVPAALSQLDAIVHDPNVLGAGYPPLSLYRAPYGTPFQDNMVDVPAMAAATAGHGVHVGWGIDTLDWECAGSGSSDTSAQFSNTPSCIMKTLNEYLNRGASGVILMHSVYKNTADTLPQVIAAIRAAGYQIVMVEDFVQAKYGASSADVMRANIAANFSAQAVSDAAVASTKLSKWYLGTVE